MMLLGMFWMCRLLSSACITKKMFETRSVDMFWMFSDRNLSVWFWMFPELLSILLL